MSDCGGGLCADMSPLFCVLLGFGGFLPFLSMPPYLRRAAAECLGTAILTLLVSLSLAQVFDLATPIVAAITLGTMVYILGPISGAHVNPAVTAGLWSIGKIRSQEALTYIVAQVVGACVALFLTQFLTGGVLDLQPQDDLVLGVAEALGALLLTLGVTSVVLGSVKSEASGIVVGSSLLLGILTASSAGNGIINPAVALGIGSLSATYVIAPLVGGVAGAWLARFLNK